MRVFRRDQQAVHTKLWQRFPDLAVFDVILLIHIFFGLVFFHLLMSLAFGSAYCPEQLAGYGQTGLTPSVFKTMFYISMLLFAVWLLLLLKNLKGKPSWGRFAWDFFTGISILLICGLYYNMSVWGKLDLPDGTLRIGTGVWVTGNSKKQWRKLPPIRNPDAAYDSHIYLPDYRHLECVWLETNKISIAPGYSSNVPDFETYIAVLQKGALRESYKVPRPKNLRIRDSLFLFWGRKSNIENLISLQDKRPLRPKEKQRFLAKQTCLQNTTAQRDRQLQDIEDICDPPVFTPKN